MARTPPDPAPRHCGRGPGLASDCDAGRSYDLDVRRITSPAVVGRTADLARLREALDAARAGRSAIVLIGGEAGIGKSRLVAAFGELAAAEGAFVAVGGSPPAGEAELAHAPLVEILRDLRRRLTPAELDAVLEDGREELARLVPAIGGGTNPESGGPATAGGGALRLFEAVLDLLERLGELKDVAVVVLEDLHWADGPTRELLGFLARNLRDAAVLLVATYRSDGMLPGHPTRILLAELDRSPRIDRWELGGLDEEAIAEQVRAILGSADPTVVAGVLARSDGNPFFVEELLAIQERGDTLPESLREILRAELTGLSPAAAEVLRWAALAGRRFSHRLLAGLGVAEEAVLMEAIRDTVRQGRIEADGSPGAATYAVRHALVREVVEADLLPAERARRHAAIAAVLEADPSASSEPEELRAAELAGHWLAADVPARALPALLAAGAAAERAYAFATAASMYDAALDLAGRTTSPSGPAPKSRQPIGFRHAEAPPSSSAAAPPRLPPVVQVVRHAAEAHALAGDPARAAELIRRLIAADPTPEAGDLVRLARHAADAGDIDVALEALDGAREAIGGRDAGAMDAASAGELARVLSTRATVLVAAGRYEEGRAAAEIAVQAAAAAGSAADERAARAALGVALAFGGDVERGLQALHAARSSAAAPRESVIRPRPSRIGDLVRSFAGLASVLDRAGRPEEAAEASREGVELARRLGVEAPWATTLEIQSARGELQLGSWEAADARTQRLLAAHPQGGAGARLHLLRARLETGRGHWDAASLHLAAADALGSATADPAFAAERAAAEAELAIWRARLGEAREAVDRGVRRLHGAGDRLPLSALVWLGVRAEADRAAEARARRMTGERADAARVATALRAELATVVRSTGANRGPAAPRELRLLPALVEAEWARLEDGAGLPAAWATAVAAAAALKDRPLQAYATWRQAEATLAAAGTAARGEAERLARAGLELATGLGAAPLVEEIEALARRARLRLTRKEAPPPAQPARDTLGLTTRELEVLSLVAAGLTNRRIAESLFITEKTAGHHVSNALAKLGASTRVEAAAIVRRLGLLVEVEGVNEPSGDGSLGAP